MHDGLHAMKSAEDTVAYLARQIGYVYHHRALLYGGSGSGVEIYLRDYHEIWAFITGRLDDLGDALREELVAESAGAVNSFANHFSTENSEADEEQVARYVVQRWRNISDRLNVPIPHEAILAELAEDGL